MLQLVLPLHSETVREDLFNFLACNFEVAYPDLGVAVQQLLFYDLLELIGILGEGQVAQSFNHLQI